MDFRFQQGQVYGMSKFIKRDDLFGKANELLPDDTLTIICKVSLVSDREKLSRLTQFKAPQGHLLEDLWKMLEQKKYSDVTFVVEGRKFLAHKAILAARSTVFASMFENEKGKTFTISDIDSDVFEEIIHFIYKDKVKNLQNVTVKLLDAAHKYALDTLKITCEKALYFSLSRGNATEILISADDHSANELKSSAIEFIAINATEIIETAGWRGMIRSHPHLIGELYEALVKRKLNPPICNTNMSSGAESTTE
ncbi:hypothetical protein J6590_070671 [Homalodisca vitripennis]|nr:hypothetical protein J6590_070671 [Homalodisca vitripennis]